MLRGAFICVFVTCILVLGPPLLIYTFVTRSCIRCTGRRERRDFSGALRGRARHVKAGTAFRPARAFCRNHTELRGRARGGVVHPAPHRHSAEALAFEYRCGPGVSSGAVHSWTASTRDSAIVSMEKATEAIRAGSRS